MTPTLEELAERQVANFRMVSLLKDNLCEMQKLMTAMSDAIKALAQRVEKLERQNLLTSPGPVWVDRPGHD